MGVNISLERSLLDAITNDCGDVFIKDRIMQALEWDEESQKSVNCHGLQNFFMGRDELNDNDLCCDISKGDFSSFMSPAYKRRIEYVKGFHRLKSEDALIRPVCVYDELLDHSFAILGQSRSDALVMIETYPQCLIRVLEITKGDVIKMLSREIGQFLGMQSSMHVSNLKL